MILHLLGQVSGKLVSADFGANIFKHIIYIMYCIDLPTSIFQLQKSITLQNWLFKEAQTSQPDFMRRLQEVAPAVPGKAWRFVDEDSRMFTAAGLHPGCQHVGPPRVFQRFCQRACNIIRSARDEVQHVFLLGVP